MVNNIDLYSDTDTDIASDTDTDKDNEVDVSGGAGGASLVGRTIPERRSVLSSNTLIASISKCCAIMHASGACVHG